MLICNILFIVIGILTFIVAKITNNLDYIEILQKIYMVVLIILNHLSIDYCTSIYEFNFFKNKKIRGCLNTITLIFICAVLFLPLNVIFDDNILDGTGLSYDAAFSFVLLSFLVISILSIYSLIKKISIKKITPFLSLMVLYVIGFAIRRAYPELIFEGFFYSYILFIMYFTIENPDVKMLTQVEYARDQAERANRAKSDFLSSMSHEIRTPLNAIVGLSEDNLSFKDQLPEQVVENSTDIMSASQTLLEIVGNILDINKIEANKMEIVENPYNFVREVTNMCKITQTRIGEKNVIFHLNMASDIPYQLIGDKGKVKEVINNLLTNAIKYTNEGTIDLNIKCINDMEKNICQLMITCQDTGRGIKAENISKLFNKFERLDVERNTTAEGTGLGLAITKALIEMMGGNINVQSQFGKGSLFVVNLPQKIHKLARPVSEKELSNTNASIFSNNPSIITSSVISGNKEGILNSFAGKKVLIVDDAKLNIKVARRALDSFSLTIDECSDGQECLNKIKNGDEYDLILMDIMMPNMSGETALAELKKNPNFKIPVIALTADAVAGAKEKYLGEGFIDYIAKPFTREQIKEKLDKIFGNDEPVEIVQSEETPKYNPNVDRFQNVPAYVFGADTKEKDENIY